MCFVRKGVLRNFAKFTGKHLCQKLFFGKGNQEKLSSFSRKSNFRILVIQIAWRHQVQDIRFTE